MSDPIDNSQARSPWNNPDTAVGSALWELSRHPYANNVGVAFALVWLLGAVIISVEFLPAPVALVVIAIGLAGFIAGTTVSSMTNDTICPSCDYRCGRSLNYCPSCSHEFNEDQ